MLNANVKFMNNNKNMKTINNDKPFNCYFLCFIECFDRSR